MAELLIAFVVALFAGIALGWLLAARKNAIVAADLAAAQARSADLDLIRRARDEVERERNDAQRDLAAVRARLEERDAEIATVRRDFETTSRDLRYLSEAHADLKARDEEREKAHSQALKELKEAREQLSQQFDAAAAKALESAQRQFLERADARFRQSEEASGQKLASLLQPVNERLQRYEEGVAKVEAERRETFGILQGQIESMRAGQESVRAEAAKLVNALRNAPKARGRWGEQQLRNVLESCGLSEHADFQTEVSVDDGEGGRFRPDVVITIPGGKTLIIDAKVSLNAYQDAFGAVDETERNTGLAAHAAAMRAHVTGLGAKSYWAQFDDAPDYVIMFVPGEHFLSAALEYDTTLWDFAFERRVLMATPTNLVAIAQTVAAVWRQEKLAREAREIGQLGKELYARLSVMGGHVAKLGRNLDLAANAYNSMVGSLESQVLTQARRFEQLNIDIGAKQIESAPVVETNTRPLTKLVAPQDVAAE
ncbi:DNA recombination protein RmuC [Sphingomonas lenta]|uniref:DNA recombination protein RmuC homolog n=1 Tax=Sphingomonas lenta TaxID=1141887 RepID=A0A2A2SHC5_9SPHN|nr:DNA recombination protein RmuC [Sphingomonas lenta]PAX08431.1 DNA recombination protein RmuC [Sphingomonas lenta]